MGGTPFCELTAGVDTVVWGHLPYTHFPVPDGTLISFWGTPFGIQSCWHTGSWRLQKQMTSRGPSVPPFLSLPIPESWALSPGSWALGWAQGWKRCLEYTTPMAAAQHTAPQSLLPPAPSDCLAYLLSLFPAGAPSFQAVLETPTSFPQTPFLPA